MALRRGAPWRHGEAIRSSSEAFAGDQSRTGSPPGCAFGPRRDGRGNAGRLWVAQAASTAEAPLGSRAPEQLVAYVNLARLAVEAAALDLMQLTQRSIGLQAFMRPNPIERISRDLATYLRHPGPDRALTDAAAWVLAQPVGAQDLWR